MPEFRRHNDESSLEPWSKSMLPSILCEMVLLWLKIVLSFSFAEMKNQNQIAFSNSARVRVQIATFELKKLLPVEWGP